MKLLLLVVLGGVSRGYFWTEWLHQRSLQKTSVEFNEKLNNFVLKPAIKNYFYPKAYYENMLAWKTISLRDQHNSWYKLFHNADLGQTAFTMWDHRTCTYDKAIFTKMYQEWRAAPLSWLYFPNKKLTCVDSKDTAATHVPPAQHASRQAAHGLSARRGSKQASHGSSAHRVIRPVPRNSQVPQRLPHVN